MPIRKPLSEVRLRLYVALAGIVSVTIGLMLTLPLVNGSSTTQQPTTIERQLIIIEEQEDSSIEIYDRSNNTQIAGFDNFTSMIAGLPEVIEDMKEYYENNENLTKDIVVVR